MIVDNPKLNKNNHGSFLLLFGRMGQGKPIVHTCVIVALPGAIISMGMQHNIICLNF